jgi:hypothetical protein
MRIFYTARQLTWESFGQKGDAVKAIAFFNPRIADVTPITDNYFKTWVYMSAA